MRRAFAAHAATVFQRILIVRMFYQLFVDTKDSALNACSEQSYSYSTQRPDQKIPHGAPSCLKAAPIHLDAWTDNPDSTYHDSSLKVPFKITILTRAVYSIQCSPITLSSTITSNGILSTCASFKGEGMRQWTLPLGKKWGLLNNPVENVFPFNH